MVRVEHRRSDRRRNGCLAHEAAKLRGHRLQLGVAARRRGEHFLELVPHAGLVERFEEGRSGDGEARRDSETGAEQLAEVGALAAHLGDVFTTEGLQWCNEDSHGRAYAGTGGFASGWPKRTCAARGFVASSRSCAKSITTSSSVIIPRISSPSTTGSRRIAW